MRAGLFAVICAVMLWCCGGAEGLGQQCASAAKMTATEFIKADCNGAYAIGYVSSSDGEIAASEKGSRASGYADSGTVSAEGQGAQANGYAGTGAITASGAGATATGWADDGGEIRAEGAGAVASGWAKGSGVAVIASGDGAFAHGINLEATRTGETVLGLCNNRSEGDSLQALFSVGVGAFNPATLSCDTSGNGLVVSQTGDVHVPHALFVAEVYVQGQQAATWTKAAPNSLYRTASGSLVINSPEDLANSDFDGLLGANSSAVVEGAGVRLLWYGSRGALRAGKATAAQWDEANIGEWSAAFGLGPTASGQGSFANGYVNSGSITASGTAAQASGYAGGSSSLIASGDSSFAGGYASLLLGPHRPADDGGTIVASNLAAHASGLASGSSSGVIASGEASFAHGINLEASNDGEAVFGLCNDRAEANTLGAIFSVGTGTLNSSYDCTLERNGLVVTQTGDVHVINGLYVEGNKAATWREEGSSLFRTASGSLVINSVEDLSNTNFDGLSGSGATVEGAGVRLVWYGSRGAFRAGKATNTQWNEAAIGDYSTAFGLGGVAAGAGSFASGYVGSGIIRADGIGSQVFGYVLGSSNIRATVDGAFARGYAAGGSLIRASARGAFAFGQTNNGGTIEASNWGSQASGVADGATSSVVASGQASFAHGINVEASNTAEAVFGVCNDRTEADSLGAIFSVGTGALNSSYDCTTQNNALVVTQTGDVHVINGLYVEGNKAATWREEGSSLFRTASGSLVINSVEDLSNTNFDGLSGSGATVEGAGVRLVWYGSRGAFRAGKATNTQWNEAAIGDYSAAFGLGGVAAGAGSFASGYVGSGIIRADGIGSQVFGYVLGSSTIRATVDGAFARGYAAGGSLIRASARGAFAYGQTNNGGTIEASNWGSQASGVADGATSSVVASGQASFAHGINLEASNTAEAVFGVCNDRAEADSLGAIFSVGTGTLSSYDCTTQNNALVVTQTGDVHVINGLYVEGNKAATWREEGSSLFRTASGSLVINSVEDLSNTNFDGLSGSGATVEGAGVRLVWYGSRGAFRAGKATNTQWNEAAIGDYSTAFGLGGVAAGAGSFASGYVGSGIIRADGIGSQVFGYVLGSSTIRATVDGAFARGYAAGGSLIRASARGAFAFGQTNNGGTIEASNWGSQASGVADGATSSVVASGQASFAHGINLEASNTAEAVFGVCNDRTEADSLGAIFSVGTGALNSSYDCTTQNNALVVTQTGDVHVINGLYVEGNKAATWREEGSSLFRTASGSLVINSVEDLSNTNFDGLSGSGATVEGAGVRLVWYGSRGAFRAGKATNTQWNEAAIGDYSTAFGLGGVAAGAGSFASGYVGSGIIRADGIGSQVFGYVLGSSTIRATVDGAFARGYAAGGSLIRASARGAFAFGQTNNGGTIEASNWGSQASGVADGATSSVVASGQASFAHGINVEASNTAEAVFGVCNDRAEADSLGAIFSVGTGTLNSYDCTTQNNALVVTQTGDVHVINGLYVEGNKAATWREEGSSLFRTASGSLVINSVEDLSNTNFDGLSGSGATVEGAGVRLVWYGSRGAFRAGKATNTQWNEVVIGDYSAAFGLGVGASGQGSFATGYVGSGIIRASGIAAVVSGYVLGSSEIRASGDGSYAGGNAAGDSDIKATASGAFAFGQANNGGLIEANDYAAHASGIADGSTSTVIASGPASFAHGVNVEASNTGEAVFGVCNDRTEADSLNAIFSVGTGALSSYACTSESNGLLLTQTGNLYVRTGLYVGGTQWKSGVWTETGSSIYRSSSGSMVISSTENLANTNFDGLSGGGATVTGAGVRLLWYGSRGAFRAGKAIGTEWNEATIGDYSAAFGLGATANGHGSFATGYVASGTLRADGLGSAVSGYVSGSSEIRASSDGSAASGYAIGGSDIKATANGAHASGYTNTAGSIEASGLAAYASGVAIGATSNVLSSGDASFAHGINVEASNTGEAVFGLCNDRTEANSLNAIFSVGTGTLSSNACTAKNNGLLLTQTGNLYVRTGLYVGGTQWKSGAWTETGSSIYRSSSGSMVISSTENLANTNFDGLSGGGATVTGAGVRLLWYGSRGAFRAGKVTGTQWNEASIGDYSAAFGLGTIASGHGSFASGYVGSGSITASSLGAQASGYVTVSGTITASGSASIASGYANGVSSGVLSSGVASFAHGINIHASNDGEAVFGICNDRSEADSLNAIFSVGSGTLNTISGTYSCNNFRNGLLVTNLGDVHVEGDIYSRGARLSGAWLEEGPSVYRSGGSLLINGTEDLTNTNIDELSTYLGAVGRGVRLLWYGSRGAFRAGKALDHEWNEEALGYVSAAFGQGTTAKARGSFASGYVDNGQIVASGESARASGYVADNSAIEASGQSSFAGGCAAQSSSISATSSASYAYGETGDFGSIMATGNASHASGIAIGLTSQIVASGDASFAHGINVEASNDGEAVFGLCNDRTEADSLNAIFSVGIGNLDAAYDCTSESNGLLLTKTGALHVKTALYVGGTQWKSGVWTETGSSIYRSSSGSMVISSTENLANTNFDGLSGGGATVTGAGVRLLWYGSRGAFRAGKATGTQWNEANIGDYSAAFGLGTTAAAHGSFANGYVNSGSIYASGDGAHASGWSSGSGTTITASGKGAFARGYAEFTSTVEATHDGSSAQGYATLGIISAQHYGAQASGAVGSATIKANAEGAYASGYALSGGHIEATAAGARATGYADGSGYVIAENYGASSSGCVESGGYIRADEKGAHAAGYAYNGGFVEALSVGSHASGVARGSGAVVRATGEGSFAHGINVKTSLDAEAVFGWCNDAATAATLDAIFSVGTGTVSLTGCSANSNGLLVTRDGDVYVEGDLYVGGSTFRRRGEEEQGDEVTELKEKVEKLEREVQELKAMNEQLVLLQQQMMEMREAFLKSSS
ncbi:hypothetical protein QOT17_007556 [Balamuthia mandrillaris]